MPITLPTVYELRAVSIKNVSQRIKFIENLYKFKGSFLLTALGCSQNYTSYANSSCDIILNGVIY